MSSPPDATHELEARYYLAIGAAFARGRLSLAPSSTDEDAFRAGLAAELKMHKFKRPQTMLPRVRRVVSSLTAFAPSTLLDVGSGRGAFLWPLLDAFPELDVTAIDLLEQRATDLGAIARGGIERLHAERMDGAALAFADNAFDGVTLLEVLEHMPEPAKAAREAVRVASRFVIATVPSKEDDNPEHVQLFDARALGRLFEEAGARRVTTEHVLNHVVVVALVGRPSPP